MIYDAENTFNWGTDMASQGTTAAYGDVIYTGAGDAYNTLWLYAHADQALSQNLTLTLETSATEAFTSKVTLGTYTLDKAKGSVVRAKVPLGNLGYLRLGYAAAASTITAGKLYAALVPDVELA